MLMLAVLPGQDRGLDELGALFSASGWRRHKVSPTAFEFSILELRAMT